MTVPYITEVLITASFAYIAAFNGFNLYLFQFVVHMVLLAMHEAQITKKLCLITKVLNEQFDKQQKKVFSHFKTSSISSLDLLFKNKKLFFGKVNLVSVYKNNFQLRIFHLMPINWATIFAVVFFVTNYAVLISQTST